MKFYTTKDTSKAFITLTPKEAISLIGSLASQIGGLPVHGQHELTGGGMVVTIGVRPEEETKKRGK